MKYAEKQLALFVAEVEMGEFKKPTHYTFASYVDKWRESASRDLAPKTLFRYNELLRLHIIPTIGSYKLEDITAIAIEDAYEELRKPRIRTITYKNGDKREKEYLLSESTIKHCHTAESLYKRFN